MTLPPPTLRVVLGALVLLGAAGGVLVTACGSGGDNGGGGTPGVDPGDAATSPVPDGGGLKGNACTTAPTTLVPVPAELYLIADDSTTMSDKLRAQSDGIQSFVTADPSRPLSAGLLLQPGTAGFNCAPGAFSAAAPLLPLNDGGADAITFSIRRAGTRPGNGPWLPALQAVTTTAAKEASDHPDRAVAVVFMADDLPDTCGTDTPALVGAVEAGAPARTFVVGLFSAPGDAVAAGLPVRAALAAAGGTGAPQMLVLSSGDVLEQALAQIRDEVACDLRIPGAAASLTTQGGEIYAALGASSVFVAPVADRAACPALPDGARDVGGDGGALPFGMAWFSGGPGIVTLCPLACRIVLSEPLVSIQARCPNP